MSGSEDEWSERRRLAVREAARILDQRADAEDCAHDALVSALDRPEALAGARCPEGWLAVVARRRAIDQTRRDKRARSVTHSFADADQRLADDTAEAVTTRLTARTLAKDIAELPPTTQAVLGRLALGDSTTEAAHALGITKRSADSHLRRARLLLRDRWLAALSTVVAALSLGRRPWRGGVTVLAATPIAFLLAVGQAPHDRDASEGAEHAPFGAPQVVATPEARTVAPPHLALAAAAAARKTAPTTTPRRMVAPDRTRASRTVVAVAPAPNTALELTHTDDGEQTPPVEAIQRCIETFTVSPTFVGC